MLLHFLSAVAIANSFGSLGNLQYPEALALTQRLTSISIHVLVHLDERQGVAIFNLVGARLAQFLQLQFSIRLETYFVQVEHLEECFDGNVSLLAYIEHTEISQVMEYGKLTLIELHEKLLELLLRFAGGLNILHQALLILKSAEKFISQRLR